VRQISAVRALSPALYQPDSPDAASDNCQRGRRVGRRPGGAKCEAGYAEARCCPVPKAALEAVEVAAAQRRVFEFLLSEPRHLLVGQAWFVSPGQWLPV
jgi:hypothetical protein